MSVNLFRYFKLLTVSEGSADAIMFVSTVEGETRCYDELGCLNITRDWYHLIYRPFNVFPLPREVIDTRFVLYTRKNPVVVSNPLFSYNCIIKSVPSPNESCVSKYCTYCFFFHRFDLNGIRIITAVLSCHNAQLHQHILR